MRVIVVGSVRGTEDDPEKADAIRNAAHEVGKELATRGHVVLVGTDNTDDVDPSVVEGALSANDKAHIEVHAPQGMLEPFKGNKSPNLRVVPHPFPDWDVTNMEVIREVDGVIAIAGRAGVVLSGISGWMLGVSVIPIGHFGGGAETLWQYASSRRQTCYHGALRDAEIDQLRAPWGKTLSAGTVVDSFEKVVPPPHGGAHVRKAARDRTSDPLPGDAGVGLLSYVPFPRSELDLRGRLERKPLLPARALSRR